MRQNQAQHKWKKSDEANKKMNLTVTLSQYDIEPSSTAYPVGMGK